MKKNFTKKGLTAIVLLSTVCSVETYTYFNQVQVLNEKKSMLESVANKKITNQVASNTDNDIKVEVKKSKKKKQKIEKETEKSTEVETSVGTGLAQVDVEDSVSDENPIEVEIPAAGFIEAEDEISKGKPDDGNTGETKAKEESTEGESTEVETEPVEVVREPVVETDPNYEVVDELYRVKKDTKELVGIYIDREDETFTKIVIPACVTKIADSAFDGYKYIKEITFAEGCNVSSIGKNAFINCSSVTDVTLPDSITSIGESAFNNCGAMVNIKLPAKLETIGKNAFDKCFSINELRIPKKVKSATEMMGLQGSAKKIIFEEGISEIPAAMFRNAQGVKSVAMYKGVTIIKKQAFMGCTSLTKITSPTTLKKINREAFKNCRLLKNYSIKPSLYYIGHEAFRDCESLESLVLNKTVTTIGRDAFAGDINLVVKVVANSMQKRYAIANNIKWTYTDAEVLRRNLSFQANSMLEKIVKNTTDEYALKKLEKYVPQGVCRAGNYTLITAYKRGGGKSIILVYDKSGKYLKCLQIPNSDHVGSICVVKNRIALSLNNISSYDYLAIISPKKIRETKNGRTIKYDYKVKLSGHADFTAFDGTYFWAGHSLDKASCALNVYKVKSKKVKVSNKKKKERRIIFSKKYTYSVPGNIQGLIINNTGKNKRELIMSQSYGVLPDSHVYVHKVNLKKDKSIGQPTDVYRLPAMLEGIEKKGKYMYLLFESASGKYTEDDSHQTEIQIDKLYRIRYDDLNKLYKD
ncbi:Leucine rich repeat-containing protein [Eubacterium uniforme]|uniref:Leucine rich repeat-containing protein n=1 Tax=Eubacterium uniforme TaxID=39495 RepID=A0A1T4VHJ0_9FIRM|nr:leucine-rich repeat domain-containing protein [Eubacterium uniforme]SKA64338.1 Leucine rich repeat-containing protein [Eubacterium uniforme]